jgi:serine/threonine protein kinase
LSGGLKETVQLGWVLGLVHVGILRLPIGYILLKARIMLSTVQWKVLENQQQGLIALCLILNRAVPPLYCRSHIPFSTDTLIHQRSSEDCIELLLHMIKPNAQERLTAAEALNHRWIKAALSCASTESSTRRSNLERLRAEGQLILEEEEAE